VDPPKIKVKNCCCRVKSTRRDFKVRRLHNDFLARFWGRGKNKTIARGAYGLTVTELEVVTVAFVSLTGVIYYLWWDKPLDVRCSIPVHLLDGGLGKIEGDVEKEETDPQTLPPQKSLPKKSPRVDEHVVVNPSPLLTTSISTRYIHF
jgi:hypothetical protein